MYPVMRILIGVVVSSVAILLFSNYQGFILKPTDDPIWRDSVAATAALAPAKSAANAVASGPGATIFNTKCAACHQPNAQGIPGVFPPLVGSAFAQGDPSVPIRIVLHGFAGKINRGGKDINGAMTPFQDLLTDDEIAAVLTHVRSSWGNKAPAVDPAMVKAIREKTKTHVAQMQEEELQKPI